MLAGNLADFSIEDLFRLLALTKKSGALRVEVAGREARVWFVAGEVCLAVADVRRFALGARLLEAGHLTGDQLRSVAQGDPLSFVLGLLKDGLVEPDVLSAVLREQIDETVGRLLRLGDGSFSFDHSEELGDWPVARHPAEELLVEGRRRAGEWETVVAQLPSLDAGLCLVPALLPGTDEISLDRGQWQLVALFDGRRTARDLADLTGRGELATYQGIATLVAAGLVELRTDSVRDLVTGPEAPPAAAPQPVAEASMRAGVDAAAMVRELASLGLPAEALIGRPVARGPRPKLRFSADVLEESAVPVPAPQAHFRAHDPVAEPVLAEPSGSDDAGAAGDQRLARDEDVNRGLLLRLIDGVKGA